MIGDFITITWIQKKGAIEGIKYAVLSLIASVIIAGVSGFVFAKINMQWISWIVTLLSTFYLQSLILKHIMKYPKNQIAKIILTAYGIDVLVSIVLVVVFSMLAVTWIVGLIASSAAARTAAVVLI